MTTSDDDFWRKTWGPAPAGVEKCTATSAITGAQCHLPAGHEPATHVRYGTSGAIVALWDGDASADGIFIPLDEDDQDVTQCDVFGHEPDVTLAGACAVCGQPAATR